MNEEADHHNCMRRSEQLKPSVSSQSQTEDSNIEGNVPRPVKTSEKRKAQNDKPDESTKKMVFLESKNILDLPDEICQYIFSYLSVNDKLEASLVCRRWLWLVNSSLLLQDIRVRVGNDINIGQEYEYFTRKFSDFEFVEVEIAHNFCKFLTHYGRAVKKLSFTKCVMSEPPIQLTGEARRCVENLRSLRFDSCYFSLFDHLPALEEFVMELTGCDGHKVLISTEDFALLNKTMPNLKIMRFTSSYRSFSSHYLCVENDYGEEDESEVNSHRFVLEYGTRNKTLDMIRNTQVTPGSLIKFLKKRKTTIVEFQTCIGMKFPSLFYDCLLKIEFLKLRKFSFNSCTNITPNYIKSICRNFSTLTELDFEKYTLLTDNILSFICTVLPGLETLFLTGFMLDSSIVEVFQLKHLRSLTLKECISITDHSFRKALSIFQPNKLTSFTIICTNIINDILQGFIEKMPKLRHLHISAVFFYTLSDQIVHYVCKNFVNLRSLELINMNINNNAVFHRNPEKHITHLKGLKILKLIGTRLSHIKIFKNIEFPELHTLFIDDTCPTLSYKAKFENQLRMQNPSLKCLKFSDLR